jgi:hypothetical protein
VPDVWQDGAVSSGGGAPDHNDERADPTGATPSRPGAPRPPRLITFGRDRLPGQFSISLVFHRAYETFRAAPLTIFGLALLVFGPISLLDAAVTQYSHHVAETDVFDQASSVSAQLFDLFVDLLGFAFFGGLLDHLVGQIHHGHAAHRPTELVRKISYGRLVSASLLFNLTVVFGVVFLIIPGLVLFTMFTFVAPIINIEGVSVLEAFRRSFRISRRYLLGAAVTVTIPFVIEQVVDSALEELPFAHGLWGEFAVGLFMSLVGTAVVVMFEVCTAYHLLELEAERVGGPAPTHGH